MTMDVPQPEESVGGAGEAETIAGEAARGCRSNIAASEAKEGGDMVRLELALLRRERELWERERRLLERELEILRCSSATTVTTIGSGGASIDGGVRGVKELLPEFDGTDNAFWKWRQQLQLIRHTYHLDENSTRILISSRLRGRALAWFHSRAEYLTLSVEELLQEMARMFDLRPGKLALRKEFESRVWKGGELFCNYYHDKMILANRIPIAEDEIVDYDRGRDGSAFAKPGPPDELPNGGRNVKGI